MGSFGKSIRRFWEILGNRDPFGLFYRYLVPGFDLVTAFTNSEFDWLQNTERGEGGASRVVYADFQSCQ